MRTQRQFLEMLAHAGLEQAIIPSMLPWKAAGLAILLLGFASYALAGEITWNLDASFTDGLTASG
ncbi:MAG: hypothetical protein ABSG65_29170 [Bryobacteraceae bacterium]|jgi:uncharacterized membrane protein YjfL (UPF0719 family)